MEDDLLRSKRELLALPAEIRNRIWSFCIPLEDVLNVRFCADRSVEEPRRMSSSPAARMLQQIHRNNAMVADLGLHLRLVNRQTKMESLPIFASKTVRFCCRNCYVEFLKLVSHKKIGVYWMRDIEIAIDLTNTIHREGYRFSLTGARPQIEERLLNSWILRALEEVKRATHQYYGRLDLMERESWTMPKEVKGDCHEYTISGMFDV